MQDDGLDLRRNGGVAIRAQPIGAEAVRTQAIGAQAVRAEAIRTQAVSAQAICAETIGAEAVRNFQGTGARNGRKSNHSGEKCLARPRRHHLLHVRVARKADELGRPRLEPRSNNVTKEGSDGAIFVIIFSNVTKRTCPINL